MTKIGHSRAVQNRIGSPVAWGGLDAVWCSLRAPSPRHLPLTGGEGPEPR